MMDGPLYLACAVAAIAACAYAESKGSMIHAVMFLFLSVMAVISFLSLWFHK